MKSENLHTWYFANVNTLTGFLARNELLNTGNKRSVLTQKNRKWILLFDYFTKKCLATDVIDDCPTQVILFSHPRGARNWYNSFEINSGGLYWMLIWNERCFRTRRSFFVSTHKITMTLVLNRTSSTFVYKMNTFQIPLPPLPCAVLAQRRFSCFQNCFAGEREGGGIGPEGERGAWNIILKIIFTIDNLSNIYQRRLCQQIMKMFQQVWLGLT